MMTLQVLVRGLGVNLGAVGGCLGVQEEICEGGFCFGMEGKDGSREVMRLL